LLFGVDLFNSTHLQISSTILVSVKTSIPVLKIIKVTRDFGILLIKLGKS
jgi:hypothetical protein